MALAPTPRHDINSLLRELENRSYAEKVNTFRQVYHGRGAGDHHGQSSYHGGWNREPDDSFLGWHDHDHDHD